MSSQQTAQSQVSEIDLTDRHAATIHLMKWLKPNPRLDGPAAAVSAAIYETAVYMVKTLRDGAELSAGLRKLREAKDCLVIQAIDDARRSRYARQD